MGDGFVGELGGDMGMLVALHRRAEAIRARRAAGQPIDEALLRRIGQRMDRICEGRDVAPVRRKAAVEVVPQAERHVEKRIVENPMATPALIADNTERRFEEVKVNMRLVIGALGRVGDLDETQVRAAGRYRELYDGAMIGAARATDYSRVRVDTSSAGTGDALDASLDALMGYQRAVRAIGMIESAVVERVVCQGESLRRVALSMGYGSGARSREELKGRLLATVDKLARHFGYVGEGPGRARMRGELSGARVSMNLRDEPVGEVEAAT